MLNNVSLMGRLTKEPELKQTAAQVSVATFTLAVERDFKNANGEKETDFINCVSWKNTAEFIAKYFQKGQLMVVAGRLQVRSWQDNVTNAKKYATDVVVDNAYFCEGKKENTNDTPKDFAAVVDDSNLPF